MLIINHLIGLNKGVLLSHVKGNAMFKETNIPPSCLRDTKCDVNTTADQYPVNGIQDVFSNLNSTETSDCSQEFLHSVEQVMHSREKLKKKNFT